MENLGWIKLYRKFAEWQWYDDSYMVHLFIHLLINANHKPSKWQGILIERGQLVTGLKKIHNCTRIPIQRIRTCLKKLEKTNEISKKSTNKFTIITICNFETYQNEKTSTNKQSTNKQQTNNKQLTTNKNIILLHNIIENEKNNIRSKNEFLDYTFENFWNEYNKKVSKVKAEKLFSKLSPTEIEILKTHVPKYVKSTPEKKYRKNPDTYLRNKCFYDEIEAEEEENGKKSENIAIERTEKSKKYYSTWLLQKLFNHINYNIELTAYDILTIRDIASKNLLDYYGLTKYQKIIEKISKKT